MNLLLCLIILVCCLLIGEIWVRIVYKSRLPVHQDERNLTYRYDSILGWFPRENSKKSYTGSRPIDIAHNSRGFRDDEHIIGTKPRMIFLGDSFVWGYDVNKSERFTEKLRLVLPDWSIYNLGVSGYGTDQEYLLLQQHYDFYMPNIVFLLFCTSNDEIDNSYNRRYRGYYKPYFVMNGIHLELRGTPVPKSENYFFVDHSILAQSYLVRLLVKSSFKFTNPLYLKLDNPTQKLLEHLHEFVEKRGAQLIVGLQEHSPELEIFLTDSKIPYVNLSNPHTYPRYGRHWTPEGHTFVTEKIYGILKKGQYLNMGAILHNTN
jgi:hypothetical protein